MYIAFSNEVLILYLPEIIPMFQKSFCLFFLHSSTS